MTDFMTRVGRGFDSMGDGARLIVKELYADGDDVYPQLNYRTGRYNVVDHYSPTAWVGFQWVGFLAARLWMLHDYTGDGFFGDHAMKLARKIGPYLASNPLPYADAGTDTYYGLCLGYEITGDAQLKDWALAAVDNLQASFKPEYGAFFQHAEDIVTYIDMPFAAQCFFWAAKWDAKFLQPIATCNDTILDCGLLRPDGSTFHAVEFDPKTGKPARLLTRQGSDDNSTWTRGQAWGIHNFTNAYEATGDDRYLEAAIRLTDWYIAHLPSDYVPFYDFDDPNHDQIPRDSCSAALTGNAMLRLVRCRPDLGPRYRPVLEGVLTELLTGYTGLGGVLLHGSWGRARKTWGVGSFPQQDIMPYGNYWFAEVLYRLLKDDWRLFDVGPASSVEHA